MISGREGGLKEQERVMEYGGQFPKMFENNALADGLLSRLTARKASTNQ